MYVEAERRTYEAVDVYGTGAVDKGSALVGVVVRSAGHSNSVRCACENKLVQISQRNGDTAFAVLILERLEVELMCDALRILII